MGNPEYYVAEDSARQGALRDQRWPEQLASATLVAAKLPLRTVFVERLLGA